MNKFNQLIHERSTQLAAVIALSALTLTACGTSETPPAPNTSTAPADPITDEANHITRDITYYPDGSRSISFKGRIDYSYPSTIYEFCDGTDLVEETLHYSTEAGSAAQRSVGHIACADGRLTETDFPKPLQ